MRSSLPTPHCDPEPVYPSVVPTVCAKWAYGAGGPAGDECQNLVVLDFGRPADEACQKE